MRRIMKRSNGSSGGWAWEWCWEDLGL